MSTLRALLWGKHTRQDVSSLDWLYLAILSGVSWGVAAGIIEVFLIWPWKHIEKWGFSASYILYLMIPSFTYAVCGIVIGGIGILFLRALLKMTRQRWHTGAISSVFGIGFGLLLVLFLLNVYSDYISGATGAFLLRVSRTIFLAIVACAFVLYLLWNRLLLGVLSGRPLLRNALTIGAVTIPVIASIALLGEPIGGSETWKEAPRPMSDGGEVRDNVLLITIDTTRADHFGCYGNELIETPAVDRFAQEGFMFRYCMSQSSFTLPSHTSIMTSTYPFYHTARTNGFPVNPALTTIAEVVVGEGYRTAAFISSFVLDDRFGLDQGFEVYDGNFDQLQYHFVYNLTKRSVYYRLLDKLGLVEEGYLYRRAETTTNYAVQWIERHKDDPFFVWIHYFDPHGPYEPLPPYDSRYNHLINRNAKGQVKISSLRDVQWIDRGMVEWCKAKYMGEVSYVDSQIDRLREAMNRLGLREKTLVIIMADHGESFTENNVWGHGGAVNKASIHIPLVFSRPGRIPQGTTYEGMCESIDVVPTILDYLKIDAIPQLHGRSLLPIMAGLEVPSDRTGYAEAWPSGKVEDSTWSIVNRMWKYIYTPGNGEGKLFHIAEDLNENEDVAAKFPEQAAEMRTELLSLMESLPPPASLTETTMDEETENALRTLGYVH